jgi:hypothetical protein
VHWNSTGRLRRFGVSAGEAAGFSSRNGDRISLRLLQIGDEVPDAAGVRLNNRDRVPVLLTKENKFGLPALETVRLRLCQSKLDIRLVLTSPAPLLQDSVNLSLTRSIDRCMFSFLISQGSCACTRARAPGCGRRARQGAS